MSYFAKADGSVTFKTELSMEQEEAIMEALIDAAMEEYGIEKIYCKEQDELVTECWFWSYGKYYDDEVEALLDFFKDLSEIAEGTLEYMGEDNVAWRFKWKNGDWEEQSGGIIYNDPDEYGEDVIKKVFGSFAS